MTYLTSAEVKTIVHLASHQIRLFLGNAEPKDFKGEAQKAITDFHKNPADYGDEMLLSKGANVEDAHQYSVRIELRGINPKGAAQVVAKGIWDPARKSALEIFRKELSRNSHKIALRTAGSSSFEFNREGVDKRLPIMYLKSHWPDVLKEMNYMPGPAIDSRKAHMVIAADGDGTIYDGPKTTHLPGIVQSPVLGPLVKYLKAGGVFMLVSGNDMTRTYRRMIDGLTPDIYSRVLLAANGGADLAYINAQGKPEFIKDYRASASEVVKHAYELDMVYIGDDKSADGNDRPAFEAVGKKNSVLVASLEETKSYLQQWMHERKIRPA